MEVTQVHCPCLRIINPVILNDLMAPNLIDRSFSKLTSAQNVPNSGSVSCADQFFIFKIQELLE